MSSPSQSCVAQGTASNCERDEERNRHRRLRRDYDEQHIAAERLVGGDGGQAADKVRPFLQSSNGAGEESTIRRLTRES